MKGINVLIVLLGFLTFNCYVNKKANLQKTVFIQGQITYTRTYCGGARPSDEILQNYATPKPYKNSKFRIYDENTKIEHFFSTDQNGNYSLNIEPGCYKIYPTKTKEQQNIGGYFCDCDLWLNTMLSEITVKNKPDTASINVEIHLQCDPCSETPVLRP